MRYTIITLVAMILVLCIYTHAMGADVRYIGPGDEPGTYLWMVDGEVHIDTISPDMAMSAYNDASVTAHLLVWAVLVLFIVMIAVYTLLRIQYRR